ncbi:murein L,D-transpeptidase family protein [Rhodoferax sp. PAMC 29310]|uniref:L,D-transpeptidase family protein n=1 Tax=Rhodoferax sp. PAMC 29310 TaxID=2822760 RepID=UPI001B32547F|nr:L,D-transpeptidase [Rhodoferax sp. PAMC 29310]
MKQQLLSLLLALSLTLAATTHASPRGIPRSKQPASNSSEPVVKAGVAESRLIEIYKLIAGSQSREALNKAELLVRDYPTFQLAHLVYGDLLAARTQPVKVLGDVPDDLLKAGISTLNELRDESAMRLKALRERPPAGAIPSQFISLSPRNKHAIAVDTSRSRLYLFRNGPNGLTLEADYYISVGKFGVEKSTEGDARTPLGVYFITSNLDPSALGDIYGTGALPLNYPNELDNKRGKTGSGIWLHGTPSAQFSRAPLATDGCVAIANPDLNDIIRAVEIRTTPVVIAKDLKWVAPMSVRADSKPFEDALAAWQQAKSSGNLNQVLTFYSTDFKSNGRTLTEWSPNLRRELDKNRGRAIQLKDLSFLRWTDTSDTMVVTFGEVTDGTRSGPTKRQYWSRNGSQWKIFYEGIIG